MVNIGYISCNLVFSVLLSLLRIRIFVLFYNFRLSTLNKTDQHFGFIFTHLDAGISKYL